jgi:hypothetical protein
MKKINRIQNLDKETEVEFLKKRNEKQTQTILNLAKERDEADALLDIHRAELVKEAFSNTISRNINENLIVADKVLGPVTFEPTKKLEEPQGIDIDFLATKLNEIDDKKKIPEVQFINHSSLEFTDISSEQYRIYEFNNGKTIMISDPLRLNISKNGGHRLFDGSGISHYIPQGWVRISWKAKPHQPNFVK